MERKVNVPEFRGGMVFLEDGSVYKVTSRTDSMFREKCSNAKWYAEEVEMFALDVLVHKTISNQDYFVKVEK